MYSYISSGISLDYLYMHSTKKRYIDMDEGGKK